MPTFKTSLPTPGKNQGYELLRTPELGTLSGICTSDNLLVCDTHFWHGRTTPCERIANGDGQLIDDSNCQACCSKQSWRTHAYVAAHSPKTGQHFIFECTAAAAQAFADYLEHAGTLRGCGFHAQRPKGRKNAKVVIVTKAVDLGKIHLPPAPDLVLALSVIWRLPGTAMTSELRTQRTDIDRGEHATERPTFGVVPAVTREMRNQAANVPTAEQLQQQTADAFASAVNQRHPAKQRKQA